MPTPNRSASPHRPCSSAQPHWPCPPRSPCPTAPRAQACSLPWPCSASYVRAPPSRCSTPSSSASAPHALPSRSTCHPASRSRSAPSSCPRRSRRVRSRGCSPSSRGRCWPPDVPNRRRRRGRLWRDRLIEVLLHRREQSVGYPGGNLRAGAPGDRVQFVLVGHCRDAADRLACHVDHLAARGGVDAFTEKPGRLDGKADLLASFPHGRCVERLPRVKLTSGELPGQVALADPSPYHQHPAIIDDNGRDDRGPRSRLGQRVLLQSIEDRWEDPVRWDEVGQSGTVGPCDRDVLGDVAVLNRAAQVFAEEVLTEHAGRRV